MLFTGLRRFRPGGPYRSLHLALLDVPHVDSNFPSDTPILEDEVRLLESQMLDLLSVINEAEIDD